MPIQLAELHRFVLEVKKMLQVDFNHIKISIQLVELQEFVFKIKKIFTNHIYYIKGCLKHLFT